MAKLNPMHGVSSCHTLKKSVMFYCCCHVQGNSLGDPLSTASKADCIPDHTVNHWVATMQCRKTKPHSKAARQQTDDTITDLTDEPQAQEVTMSDPATMPIQSKPMSCQTAEAAKAATQQASNLKLEAEVVDSAASGIVVLQNSIKQSENPAAQGKHVHASTGKASVKPASYPASNNPDSLPQLVPASATGWPQAPASASLAPPAPLAPAHTTARHPVAGPVRAPASSLTCTQHPASAQRTGHEPSPTQAPAFTPRLAKQASSTFHHADTHLVPTSMAEMGRVLNGSLPAAHQLSQHSIQQLQAAFGDVALLQDLLQMEDPHHSTWNERLSKSSGLNSEQIFAVRQLLGQMQQTLQHK